MDASNDNDATAAICNAIDVLEQNTDGYKPWLLKQIIVVLSNMLHVASVAPTKH